MGGLFECPKIRHDAISTLSWHFIAPFSHVTRAPNWNMRSARVKSWYTSKRYIGLLPAVSRRFQSKIWSSESGSDLTSKVLHFWAKVKRDVGYRHIRRWATKKEISTKNLRVQFVVPKSISRVWNTRIVDILHISFSKIKTQWVLLRESTKHITLLVMGGMFFECGRCM